MNKKQKKQLKIEESDLQKYDHVEVLTSLGVWQENHYLLEINESKSSCLTSYVCYSENQESQGKFSHACPPVQRDLTSIRRAANKGREFLPRAFYKTPEEFFGFHKTYGWHLDSEATTVFDTPRPKGTGILDSTSPLRLDPLRYLTQRWFSPQALLSPCPGVVGLLQEFICSNSVSSSPHEDFTYSWKVTRTME